MHPLYGSSFFFLGVLETWLRWLHHRVALSGARRCTARGGILGRAGEMRVCMTRTSKTRGTSIVQIILGPHDAARIFRGT